MVNPDWNAWQQSAKINTTRKVVLNQKNDDIKRIEASLTKLFDKEEDKKDKDNFTYEEKYAMDNFHKKIKMIPEGRYSIVPMFKENAKPLKNNCFLSLMRYRSLKTSLSNHLERKKAICNITDPQLMEKKIKMLKAENKLLKIEVKKTKKLYIQEYYSSKHTYVKWEEKKLRCEKEENQLKLILS